MNIEFTDQLPASSITSEFIAHVKQLSDGQWITHSLEDHLEGTAKLAATFAEPFGNSDWAYLAGIWHDLGKYSKQFQSYIRTASGFDVTAHLEGAGVRVDHSTAGAIHACQNFKFGKTLAYLIAGHHAGLADDVNADAGQTQLSQRLTKMELYERVKNVAPDNVLNQLLPTSKPPGKASALWIRFLFSCLVDADFLDTELFMDPAKAMERSGLPALSELAPSLNKFLNELENSAHTSTVNLIRRKILEQCLTAATLESGVFSLTVPTGGGKTLSSLAFAMRHALHHNKERIIYVIPYMSIVEQTANLFRAIFGDCVIEHHSNFDPDTETPKSRLACENWDAPVIVTTNVQFFESLFSNRTSRTRKLHRIANSVVILDEAQLIPPDFLKPIVESLKEISRAYKTSLVICTATQPVLTAKTKYMEGFEKVTEIIANPDELYVSLKRVNVLLPKNLNESTTPEALANVLRNHEKVLCIVNRKDECRELFKELPSGTLHLSGFMCGAHRSKVIEDIRTRLLKPGVLRVVSTQLVEAGVDVDFPVVYRALSGVDSIAQAAGRCNREGLLACGEVNVFVPWKPSPPGHLRHMEQATKEVLATTLEDVMSPKVFTKYFEHLYWMKGTALDKHEISLDLQNNATFSHNFRSAARKFRIIDDSRSIFVRYLNSTQLLELLKKQGPDRWLLRKLQRYCVSVRTYLFEQLFRDGDVVEIHPGYFAQAQDGLYHPQTGFLGDRPDLIDVDTLIV